MQTDAAELAGSLVYYTLTANGPNPISLIESFLTDAVSNNQITLAESIVLNDHTNFATGAKVPLGDLPKIVAGSIDGKDTPTCSQLIHDASGPLSFAQNVQGLLDKSCSSNVTMPCDLGRATKELVAGDTVSAEADLELAIAAVMGAGLNPPAADSLVQSIASLIQRYFAAYATNPSVDPETYIKLDPTLPTDEIDTVPFKNQLLRAAREWTLATGASKQGMTLSNFTRYLLEGTDALALCTPHTGQSKSACGNVAMLLGAGAADLRRIIQAASGHDVAAVAMDVLRDVFTIRNALNGDDCPGHPANHVSRSATGYELRGQQRNLKPPPEKKAPPASSPNQPAPATLPATPASPTATGPESPDCDRQVIIGRYGQFLASLVAYSVEVATTGKSTSQTQGAFESAVFDVLQTDGPNAGTNRDFGTNVFVPKPSLRLSWNSGYVNDVTSDGFRYVATLDVLTFRIPFKNTQGIYFAMDGSLVDLLGPFSESALRKQSVNYDSGSLEWAEFLDPKIEVMFGIPSLTTHLVLTGGLSYRTAAVATNSAGNVKYYSPYTGMPSDYTSDRTSYFSQFVEVGVGVKYLP